MISSPMDPTTAKAYISVALSGVDSKAEHLCLLVDIRACEGWRTWATAPPSEIIMFNEFALTKKASLINQAMAAISAKTPADFEAQKPIYQRRYAAFIKDFCDLMDTRNTRLVHSLNYLLQENTELRQQLASTEGVAQRADAIDGGGEQIHVMRSNLQDQGSDAHADESYMLADDEK